MTDLYNFIKNCENGKRIWVEDELGRKDYSLSYKSTYPEWSRFYFVKTPKNKRHIYNKDNPAWKDGYYNGNTTRLYQMFENALAGKLPKSERMLDVFDKMIEGYYFELKEIEYLEADCIF